MTITVTTNNVPRELIDGCELSTAERESFDYLNWRGIDAGEDSATFFRYRGRLYDLAEFMSAPVDGWDGGMAETFYSGVLVKLVSADDYETVIVGNYYS